MTETNPSNWSLVALLLAAVVLPPLTAATVLRAEPETPAPARAHHAAFCADSAPARQAPPSPVAVAAAEPALTCGSASVR